MVWKLDGPVGNEARKIKYEIVPYTRGKVLDLGSGPWKPYAHFIGIDLRQEWTDLPWNPDINMDCLNLSIFADGSIDAVFSSHLLEHLDDPEKALKEWWRVIKVGGHLVLYLPHRDLYPNSPKDGGNKDHKWNFVPGDIIQIMKNVGKWDLVRNDTRNDGDEYSFFQVFRKESEDFKYSYLKQRPDHPCGIIRYGGIGDMIQTSSIFPYLKERGFHITMITTPEGMEILKHDPHVDEFLLQDKNQVSMEDLGNFWAVLKKKFDRFINLTESVEVALLIPPSMTCWGWPKAARDKRFNTNYLELTHAIADVPYPIRQAFYATPKEREQAAFFKRKVGGNYVILWCLSGSSIHKAWPYMDAAIARIFLTNPDARIVFTGDHLSKILEKGWENEKRVFRMCGEWNPRQSLTFACHGADLVIGPETGVLNAVAFTETPKIITMSHSSVENLTKDWKNCMPLVPHDCECYPCHQLNTNFSECPRDDVTGVAKCQASISLENMWAAISFFMNLRVSLLGGT